MHPISKSIRTRMRVLLITAFFALPSLTSAGDVDTPDALRGEILAMDARLSEAYGECSAQRIRALFTDDAELVFAERGIERGVGKHIDAFRRRGCNLQRMAPASAQRIYALPGHLGALDGALQLGSQTFCARDAQPCRGMSTHFIAVWRHTADGWKVSRLIRHGYGRDD
jgi:Domain of unknown function (DUF4440)